MGRPKKYDGEDSAPIRVPKSTVDYVENLIDNIWLYIKKHPASKDETILLVFKYLVQKMLEFSDLQGDQEQDVNPEFKGEIKKVQFRTPENSPVRFPSKYDGRLSASFGLETVDEEETPGEPIDIHQVLIRDPDETLITFVVGDSMNKAGINNGDLLIFKKFAGNLSDIRDGAIVIAQIEGNQTVKRLNKESGRFFLCPDSDNEEHKEIEIKKGIDISGIVLYSIHSLQPRHTWGI